MEKLPIYCTSRLCLSFLSLLSKTFLIKMKKSTRAPRVSERAAVSSAAQQPAARKRQLPLLPAASLGDAATGVAADPVRADPGLEVVDEGQDREEPTLSVEEVRVEARPLAPRRWKAARKSTSKKSRPVLRGSGRAGGTPTSTLFSRM